MQTWLEWARGPAFWFALTFMALGLARHVLLTAWGRSGRHPKAEARAVLSDSVPPLVKMISSGSAPRRAATCSRAVSTAFFAGRAHR